MHTTFGRVDALSVLDIAADGAVPVTPPPGCNTCGPWCNPRLWPRPCSRADARPGARARARALPFWSQVLSLRRELCRVKVELAEVTGENAELEHVTRRLNKQLVAQSQIPRL